MIWELVLTSHLFLVNSYLAFKVKKKHVSLLLAIVYMNSCLHHLTNEHDSIYHKADIVSSRFATITLITYSLYYSQMYQSFMSLNNIVLSYLTSRLAYLSYPNNNTWLYFHMYFHFITNFSIYILILKMRKSAKIV